MTPTKQEPRECKQFHEITKGYFVYGVCELSKSSQTSCLYRGYFSHCPYFTPKDSKKK